MDAWSLILAVLAAIGAGFVNALAGGGTLITFPTLVALGVPPVAANVTSTVSLCPGYFGATLAQAKDLLGQRRRLWLLVPAGAIGGLCGGLLLLYTSEKVFRDLVPYLILLASGLLAVQTPVRNWLTRRLARGDAGKFPEFWIVPPVILAAVYGGYFGAGLSVIVLAALGLFLNDSLTRLNALKQSISFGTNVAAALLFVFSGKTLWIAALVMAVGALLGGTLGGKLAGRVKPGVLRAIVVSVGVVVGAVYLLRS